LPNSQLATIKDQIFVFIRALHKITKIQSKKYCSFEIVLNILILSILIGNPRLTQKAQFSGRDAKQLKKGRFI
jgi:hypothetical protein